MQIRPHSVLWLVLLLACDKPTAAPEGAGAEDKPEERVADPVVVDEDEADPSKPAVANDAPEAAAPDAPPDAPPDEPAAPSRPGFSADGLTPAKRWPFYAWDSARVYAFNLDEGGGSQRVYSERKGWSDRIAIDRELSMELAKRAVGMVGKTQGTLVVSKCPYPRHAVVLFSGETPVASINVCFSCGDIMIWPPYRQAHNWSERKNAMYPKLMKAYKGVYPKWERLFAKDLEIPTEWKLIPKSGIRPR